MISTNSWNQKAAGVGNNMANHLFPNDKYRYINDEREKDEYQIRFFHYQIRNLLRHLDTLHPSDPDVVDTITTLKMQLRGAKRTKQYESIKDDNCIDFSDYKGDWRLG